MANVINSVRNIASDTWWVPKLLVLNYLMFLIVLNFDYLLNHQSSLIALVSLTLVLFTGSAAIMINRNINNETPLLPNIMDFPQIILKSFLSIILMLPASLIAYFTLNYMILNPFFEGNLQTILVCIVALLFTPFIFIPIVLYGVKGRFFDGYRIDLIIQGGGDFIVKMLSYALQYFFVIYLFSFLVYLGIKAMMGEESTAVYLFISFVLTLSFFSFFSYISDLYEESIPVIKSNKNKKTKKKKHELGN